MSLLMSKLSSVLLSLLVIGSLSYGFSDTNNDGMIIRICPPPGRRLTPHGWRCTGYPFSELMENPDDWGTTRSIIDYFGYASWILNDNFTNAELSTYFAQLDTMGVNFVLGVIALKNLNYARSGELCYAIESARWNRYDSLGLEIAALGIDEPFTAADQGNMGQSEFPILTDVEYAIRETADWIELVRADSIVGDLPISLSEAYPRTSFASPTGTCKDDLLDFISGLQEECDERGIDGIADLSLDYDWAGYGDSSYWQEVIEIEEFADSIGLPFAMIFWPADHTYPAAEDEDFLIDILYQGNLYLNTYNGEPDIFDITSWNYIPIQQVPESYSPPKPVDEFPFTYSFLNFYDTFLDAEEELFACGSASRRLPVISSISPNPVASNSMIHFMLSEYAHEVHISVYDICGRSIFSQSIGNLSPGSHTFLWNCRDSSGKHLSPGVYFVQIALDASNKDMSRVLVIDQ